MKGSSDSFEQRLRAPEKPSRASRLIPFGDQAGQTFQAVGEARLVFQFHGDAQTLDANSARGGDYIRDYYSYFGPGAEDMARSIPSSPETIEGLIRGFGDIGADEVVCWPTVAELDQVDRLAEIIS